MTYRVSMDIGGTFTDVVAYDEATGTYAAAKSSTTPHDLTEGVFNALGGVGADPAEIAFTVHGTTQGLNAFLQRRGVPVLLLATEGTGDVYQIARGNRNRLFDVHYRKPRPLVERSATAEIGGRLDHSGREIAPLDEDALRAAAARFRAEDFGAIAVCFLFSYLNPAHERRAAEVLRAELGPDAPISLSHEVAREWREYERTSSAVVEAYTAPVVRTYLSRLEKEFAERGLGVPVHVMQSSGGIVSAETARRAPLQTLLSGPVGGTMGGVALARSLGRRNLICVDMGGTSFDVSLVVDGRPDVSTEAELEGFPLLMPVVNIHTIGAGGGSVAHVEGGGLRVGPESAGADPGPACYGRGGTRPTVTDANCVLGRVDPDWFAGGHLRLDVDAARRALSTVGDELGLDPVELAEGVCDVANAKMAQAIRTLTVEQGIEPKDFSLVAFGGAGAMHAAFLAAELGIGEVVVPRWPGAFSAWGMLETDIRKDFSRPHFAPGADLDGAEMSRAVRDLEHQALEALAEEGVAEEHRRVEHAVDVRYVGQQYTLPVALRDTEEPAEAGFLDDVRARFSALHERRYGHANPAAPVEFVALRTTAFGELPRIAAPRVAPSDAEPPRTTGRVVFDREARDTPVFRRDDLPAGFTVEGPAVVVESTATTVVPPRFRCAVDDSGALVLTPGGAR
ncbi:hydantoinase/oxoprolinase family protein [Saccharopolyspora rosea]|uniref:Hydantoinase/oxoprolinase family protein n=1 Tax=Saccharopolyspora rosea TaxID=524884 RepID=A0ABW3FY40_9PSEU|nr:hydantoinase/oxoprolinase family protein [Saccharopolyspora rosea]